MHYPRRSFALALFVLVGLTLTVTLPHSPIGWVTCVLAAGDSPKYNGPAACSAQECHGSTVPKGDGRTVHNEYALWVKNDRHSKAYASLGSPKGIQIAQRMKIQGDPRKADRCLTCHTLNATKDQQGNKYDVADGVSCDACHGSSEKYLEPHSKSRPEHKNWTRAQSLAAGMTDTLDLAVRANICVRCHLAIDHDMLEAGHPYMTFELDAHQVRLPPHWKREAPFVATKAWAAGQAVALRDSLKQLNHRVEANASSEYVENALKLCLAYYSTVRRLAEQVLPDSMKSIDAEISWLRGAAPANKDRVRSAATPAFQDKLYDLAKRLGAIDFNAETNKKLMLSYASATEDMENCESIDCAEQIFFAIDSLYRPYAQTVQPKNITDMGIVMDKLESLIKTPKTFKVEEFNTVLKDFAKYLQ